VAHADTDREGKFTLKHVPAGEYTVVCRAYKPSWDGPIFWAVDLDCPQDSKIELTPKNLYHGLGR